MHLRELVKGSLKQMGLAKKIHAHSVLLYWRQIVGDDIAEHAEPIRVDKGVLLVGVSNSVWMHHLFLLKSELIDKVHTYIGEPIIKDIRFMARNKENKSNEENEHETQQKDSVSFFELKKVRLTEEELEHIDDIAKEATVPEIKKRMISILRKDAALRKLRCKAGWQPCSQCGSLRPASECYCLICDREQRNSRLDSIRKFLMQAPWITYEEIQKCIPCSPFMYRTVKIEFLQRWGEAVRQGYADYTQQTALVMLLTGLGPDKLTDEMISQESEKIRRKRYVSTPRC